VGGEGGVVTAAVFGVKDECQIEQTRFEVGELSVFAQQCEQVFGGGEFGIGLMDEQAFSVVIVLVRGTKSSGKPPNTSVNNDDKSNG
jgi:hypothetical protein